MRISTTTFPVSSTILDLGPVLNPAAFTEASEAFKEPDFQEYEGGGGGGGLEFQIEDPLSSQYDYQDEYQGVYGYQDQPYDWGTYLKERLWSWDSAPPSNRFLVQKSNTKDVSEHEDVRNKPIQYASGTNLVEKMQSQPLIDQLPPEKASDHQGQEYNWGTYLKERLWFRESGPLNSRLPIQKPNTSDDSEYEELENEPIPNAWSTNLMDYLPSWQSQPHRDQPPPKKSSDKGVSDLQSFDYEGSWMAYLQNNILAWRSETMHRPPQEVEGYR